MTDRIRALLGQRPLLRLERAGNPPFSDEELAQRELDAAVQRVLAARPGSAEEEALIDEVARVSERVAHRLPTVEPLPGSEERAMERFRAWRAQQRRRRLVLAAVAVGAAVRRWPERSPTR